MAPVSVPVAQAQVEDDDWLDDFQEDEEEDEAVERESAGDEEIDMAVDPEDLEAGEEEEPVDEMDFLDEESDIDADVIGGEGVDNAKIYRATTNKVREMGFEEELITWERYLETWPKSLFKQHITDRMEQLVTEAYGERIGEQYGPRVDAGRRELDFAVPLHLESIDPRTRLRVGFEMGYPNHIAFGADYEHQFLRSLSGHAGLQGRYQGLALVAGGRYAAIKSARTGMLLTGVVDILANDLLSAGQGTSTYVSLRPVIGFGKQLDVAEGMDIQVQVGSEWEIPNAARGSRLIYTGGVNVFVHLNDSVGAIMETSTNMKSGLEESTRGFAPFAFNVLTFGLRFQPGNNEQMRISAGTNVPYFNNYWGHHFGAVQGDMQMLLGD
jgi:hypothetical protein